MQPKQTDNARLFPTQDLLLRKAIEASNFFAPWTGEVETGLVSNADGTVTREIVASTGNIVDRITGFVGKDADTAQMPLLRGLVEEPLTGNAYFPGTGEALRYQYRKVFINQIGKMVEKQKGLLDRHRTDKLEQTYKQAGPALLRYMIKWANAEAISAIYDGHSMNVTKGTDSSPDGIGANKVLHPNMYTNGVHPTTAASGNVLDDVGTDRYNKTVAEVNASKVVTGTVGSDLFIPSPRWLDKVGEKLSDLEIQQKAMYNGNRYWLAVVNREILNHLKQNDTFRTDLREAFVGKEYDNPLFTNKAYVFDEFLFVIDKKVPRIWNEDTDDFAGDNGYVGVPTLCDSTPVNHRFMAVLGENALGYSNVVPYETRLHNDNVDLFVELLALQIFGWGRGEYVNDTKESTYFAKGNTTTTTLAEAVEVFNQSSALFAVGLT